jgi:hypothetical protein
MKKADLKKVLKPIVKECIQEALLEEGLLSNVIAEVVKGLNVQPLVEQVQPEQPQAQVTEQKIIDEETQKRKQKINETRKQMLDAIGKDSYNGIDLFEGTDPMRESNNPHSPLANTDPSDAGIDISNLLGNKKVWKTLAGN